MTTQPGPVPVPRCIGCGKTPSQLTEYQEAASGTGLTPEAFVRSEDGSYNRDNGHFACTPCYIDMGIPSSPRGWVAP